MDTDNVYLVTCDRGNALAENIAKRLAVSGKELIVVADNSAGQPVHSADVEIRQMPIGSEEMAECLGGLENRLTIIHWRRAARRCVRIVKKCRN